MITRIEAKALADSVISPERRQEIEMQLDNLIHAAASQGAYMVLANVITKEYNEVELVFARDLLRAAPHHFTTADFANDSDHWIYWS